MACGRGVHDVASMMRDLSGCFFYPRQTDKFTMSLQMKMSAWSRHLVNIRQTVILGANISFHKLKLASIRVEMLSSHNYEHGITNVTVRIISYPDRYLLITDCRRRYIHLRSIDLIEQTSMRIFSII